MSVDLVILGLLMERPRSAYEIVHTLNERQARRWIKTSDQGVYRNVRLLHERGFVDARKDRQGNMPERTVYTMTESGHAHFIDLMSRAVEPMGPIYFEFNAAIANLHKVDPAFGLQLLHRLRRQLLETSQLVEGRRETPGKPLVARSMIRQYGLVFQALITWIDELIPEYENHPKNPEVKP